MGVTRNKTRRLLSASVAAATLVSMATLAGCGSSETEQEENPTTLVVWYYEEDTSAMGQAWQHAIELFEEQTGVTVEFEQRTFDQIRQNASQILNSDEAPDVMEYNKGSATAGLLSSQGLLTNLNDYVEEYGWDEIITGSLATTGLYDEQGIMGSGDWYGITNYGEDVMMYYNVDMFDEYGIEIPTTYDELIDAMDQFVAAGVTPLAFEATENVAQHMWWQLVLMNADDDFLTAYEMYDGDVDWSSDALVNATQTLQDWLDAGYYTQNCTGVDGDDMSAEFINGSYPIFFSGTWWYGTFETEMTDTNWTAETFPGAERVPGSSGNIWVIPENSTRKDLAAQFIDITLSEEVQNLMGNAGGIPIAADSDAITDEQNQALIESFNTVLDNDGLGYYPDWPTSTLYDELNAALQELINGTTDVDGCLEMIENYYTTGVESEGYK